MVLDTMKYTNTNGDVVDFMSVAVRSNPRESKLWTYMRGDTSFGVQSKEFDLTVICATYNGTTSGTTANTVINKLSYDVEHAAWGVLEVNGWFLDCCFTGVTNIETDLFGVTKFSAHFSTRWGFRWWKRQTFNFTDSGSRPWSSGTNNLNYPFASFKIMFKTKASTNYNFDIRSSSSTVKNFKFSVPSGETKLYYMFDSHNKLIKKGANYSVNYSDNSWTLSGSQADAISDVTEGYFLSNCALKSFEIRINSGALDDTKKTVHVEAYLERGMPEWTTT